MDIEKEIRQIQKSMSQLWKIVRDLQDDGLDPLDPLFDDLALKSWQHIFRWEVLGFQSDLDKYQTYGYMGMTERSIPERIFREFDSIRFQGLNAYDHHHWQN